MLLGFESKEKTRQFHIPPYAVLDNEQMRTADRLTIEDGVDGFDLMLTAGQAVANYAHEHYAGHKIIILCGPGNNGGDGYVAAEFLRDLGAEIFVFSLQSTRKLKGDTKKAYKHFGGDVYKTAQLIKEFKNADAEQAKGYLFIDAVFGTGFHGDLPKDLITISKIITRLKIPVLAVDVPSGVNGSTAQAAGHTLDADHTVTFFRKKKAHCLMPAMAKCGTICVHAIGIHDNLLDKHGFAAIENVQKLWIEKLPEIKKEDHKYNRGHIAMLGGAEMTGAIRMAAQASMRAGAGMCTIHSLDSAAHDYKEDMPHLMFQKLSRFEDYVAQAKQDKKHILLLGPGFGRADDEMLKQLVLDCLALNKPAVLDADALSCFEDNPSALTDALHEKCVITPHEGEFKRLFPNIDGDTKFDRTLNAAQMTSAVIVHKGADTIIAQNNNKPALHTHASSWLSTAGAGDVLAGIIAGLLGQHVAPYDAACMGAWMYGEASVRFGAGLTAPDIIDQIPSVLKDLHLSKEFY